MNLFLIFWLSLPAGFLLDLLIGDPHKIPHPVVLIGKLITLFEKLFRRICPKTASGERMAGLFIWICVVVISAGVPALILWICYRIHPWLLFAAETVMCAQMLAVKSLKDESMKVFKALKTGDLEKSRYAVSMIVGRDTERLDEEGVTKAAIETVAENSSDGVIAPMLFFAIGGAPLGFLYKAVNTMDSMLGYVEEPYKNVGLVPAKMDDVFNFIPARLAAILMLMAGWVLKLDVKNGWKIFRRDRYNHASPNSAQTESVCAGLLRIRLGGDAWYHGVLHKKKTIGDALRPVVHEDIPLACTLMVVMAVLMLVIGMVLRLGILCAVLF